MVYSISAQCPPVLLENGIIVRGGSEIGNVAQFQCDDMFKMSGNSTRQCLPNGHWSGSKPECKHKNNKARSFGEDNSQFMYQDLSNKSWSLFRK